MMNFSTVDGVSFVNEDLFVTDYLASDWSLEFSPDQWGIFTSDSMFSDLPVEGGMFIHPLVADAERDITKIFDYLTRVSIAIMPKTVEVSVQKSTEEKEDHTYTGTQIPDPLVKGATKLMISRTGVKRATVSVVKKHKTIEGHPASETLSLKMSFPDKYDIRSATDGLTLWSSVKWSSTERDYSPIAKAIKNALSGKDNTTADRMAKTKVVKDDNDKPITMMDTLTGDKKDRGFQLITAEERPTKRQRRDVQMPMSMTNDICSLAITDLFIKCKELQIVQDGRFAGKVKMRMYGADVHLNVDSWFAIMCSRIVSNILNEIKRGGKVYGGSNRKVNNYRTDGKWSHLFSNELGFNETNRVIGERYQLSFDEWLDRIHEFNNGETHPLAWNSVHLNDDDIAVRVSLSDLPSAYLDIRDRLTTRDDLVMCCLFAGLAWKSIAKRFSISEKTISKVLATVKKEMSRSYKVDQVSNLTASYFAEAEKMVWDQPFTE